MRTDRTAPRVEVSAATLVPGGMGGSETYTRRLIEHLAGRSDVQVHVVQPASASDMGKASSASTVSDPPGSTSAARLAWMVRHGLRRFPDGGTVPDVVHYPLTVGVPRAPRASGRVVTLHDVQHLDLPGHFSVLERAYRRLAYDRPSQTADVVLTLSAFSKARIAHHLAIPPERIVVAPLGHEIRQARRRPATHTPFVLYPARYWPHKNHHRLVDAVARLRDQGHPDLRLVLTGDPVPAEWMPHWVEQRGLVSREDLLDLYSVAACLAFPSLYEGFGLPPLEAMASGCPVVASSSGAVPEVCGDAAVTVDPLDVEDIARGIRCALDGGDRLVARGLERAARFSWSACADEHVRAYRVAMQADL